MDNQDPVANEWILTIPVIISQPSLESEWMFEEIYVKGIMSAIFEEISVQGYGRLLKAQDL